MKKQLITIGIVQTRKLPFDFQRRFSQWGFVDIITPGKRSGKFDIVVIPDEISAYVGMNCFIRPQDTIGLPPMDNLAEYFRTNDRGLPYYAKDTTIIGIGDGAVMLWDYLKFKACVEGQSNEIKLIYDAKQSPELIWKKDDLFVQEWKHGNFIGVEDLWSSTLRTVLNEIVVKLEEDDDMIEKFFRKPMLKPIVDK